MNKARWMAILVAFAFAAFASSAMANQINISGPSSGTLTYTSTGTGTTLTLAFSPTVSDSASFVLTGGILQDTGTYSFTSTTSPINLTAGVGGAFNVTGTATSTFSYTATDSDTLDGTVTWTTVNDNSSTPTIHGSLLIASLSGDSTFVSTFGAIGDTVGLDFNITGSCTPAISPCTLTNLVTQDSTTDTMSGAVSAGEVAVEPSSIALLGVVLLGGLLVERKKVFA